MGFPAADQPNPRHRWGAHRVGAHTGLAKQSRPPWRTSTVEATTPGGGAAAAVEARGRRAGVGLCGQKHWGGIHASKMLRRNLAPLRRNKNLAGICNPK